MRRASLVGGGRRQPRPGSADDSVKLLVIASALVILAAAAAWFMHGKAKTARDTNAQAVAAKSVADSRLQQAGGDPATATPDSGEAAQIIELADGRMNWRRVLLDLSAATPVGVKVDAFSAAVPGSASATGVTLNGNARDQAQLQQFIKGLRSKPRSFKTVELHGVQQSDSAGVTFSVAVTLTPPDTDTKTPPEPADPAEDAPEPAQEQPERPANPKPAAQADRADGTSERRDTPRKPSSSRETTRRDLAPDKDRPARDNASTPARTAKPDKASPAKTQAPGTDDTGASDQDKATKPPKGTGQSGNAGKGEQPARGPVDPGGGATAPREESR